MDEIIGAILFSVFVTSLVALLILSFTYSKLSKYAVIALAGTVMIAHGTRMIAQTLLYPNVCYKANLFDLIFDWLTLILLGVFVAWFGFIQFYLSGKSNSRQNKIK